jgi:hypothetical protein
VDLLKPSRARLGELLLPALLLAAAPAAEPAADQAPLDASLVRAMYSYKFGKFIRWPRAKLPAGSEGVNFCVLGHDPFGRAALGAIEGRPVQGHPLSVELYASGLLPDDALELCHILYVSDSEKQRLAPILAALDSRPVLTISDIRGFSRHGGMITLVESRGRIRFEVNLRSLQRAGLGISSKILELATVIDPGPLEGGSP